MATNAATCSLPAGEEELVLLAQAGDDRAFTMLVALCEPMLRAQVARHRSRRMEAEDLAQEGLLGLLSAVRSFRPEGGASFRTYAAVCVRNRLLSALRRSLPADTEPLEEAMSVSSPAGEDPAALLVAKETAEQLLERIQNRLSPQEYAVLLRFLDGESYAEIAAALSLSSKAVDSTLQRVRRKLQPLFSK